VSPSQTNTGQENKTEDKPMTNNTERRTFTRIHFDGKTTLHQKGQQWPVELIDLSLKGLLVKQPTTNWTIDFEQALDAHIQLNGETEIIMTVNWRHSDNGQLGFECKNIAIESMIHLRRLVELNLNDPALLERELLALGN
jgi:hypothetical protein